jgi:hypothetical protein
MRDGKFHGVTGTACRLNVETKMADGIKYTYFSVFSSSLPQSGFFRDGTRIRMGTQNSRILPQYRPKLYYIYGGPLRKFKNVHLQYLLPATLDPTAIYCIRQGTLISLTRKDIMTELSNPNRVDTWHPCSEPAFGSNTQRHKTTG